MINIFAKKITSDDKVVIARIKNYFIKQLGDIDFKIIDVINYSNPIVEGYSILCGNVDFALDFGEEYCTIRIAALPNLLTKEKNTEALKEFQKIINTYKTFEENQSTNNTNIQENYVEKNNVKLGNSDIVDIKITEKEADYLNKIKNLLGGSKIILTKGDIKIEVE